MFSKYNCEVIELKQKVIRKFIDWKWLDFILDICRNNNKFCANYSLFIVDLIGRCTYDIESAQLFKNKSSVIIKTFVNGLLKVHNYLKINLIVCCVRKHHVQYLIL